MSHFSVAVWTEPGGKDITELLAPYDENLVMERYVRFTKEELIEEKRKEYQNYQDTTYAEYIKDPKAYEERCRNNLAHLEYVRDIFPQKLKYSDEMVYKDAIQFYEPEDIDSDGNVYSTYNPLSKWDWYQEGGRFRNIKNEYMNTSPERIHELERFWEVVVEGDDLQPGEDENNFVNFYRKEYYKEFYKTKELFIKINTSFSTFAVVTPDGEWYEKGKMGWFGCSSETGDENLDWELHYQERFIDSMDPNWIMTIVDCHI